MTTLTKDEIFEIAAVFRLEPGQQIHVNHAECPAGEDRKQRLYIKRTHDGSRLLMYCHHCGSKGTYKFSTGRHVPVYMSPASAFITEPGFIEDGPPSEWVVGSTQKKPWNDFLEAYDKGFNTLTPEEWPLCFFNSDEVRDLQSVDYYGARRVYMSAAPTTFYAGTWIPRWNSEDEIVGFDIRTTHPQAPKWLRVKARNHIGEYIETCPFLTYQMKESDYAVLVEDPISAWKIALTGAVGVSLCGSELDDMSVFSIAKRYQKLLVWLDNDSHIINEKADKLFRRFQLYASDVKIERILSDPKNYSVEEIARDVL